MSRGFAVATQGRAGSHLYGTSGMPAVAASGTWMCARVLLVLRRWPPRITAVVASWRWRLAAPCGLDVFPLEVGYAADRRAPPSPVHAGVVVTMDAARKRAGAVGLSPVCAHAQPLTCQRDVAI